MDGLVQIVNTLAGVTLVIFLVWMTYLISGLNVKQAAITRKVNALAVVAKASHEFLNHEKEDLLRRFAEACRKTADVTKSVSDAVLAEEAESAYRSHVRAQQSVDKQPGTDAEKQGK